MKNLKKGASKQWKNNVNVYCSMGGSITNWKQNNHRLLPKVHGRPDVQSFMVFIDKGGDGGV